MKTIYNAGSMFTEAQWNTRKVEGEELRKLLPDFEILNPVDFDTNQTDRPQNWEIFAKDYKEIKRADYVIFEIDGWDSGTHMEFGLAVEQALANPGSKKLMVVMSDFRIKQGILKGELPGFSMNEMISGAFEYPSLNEGEVPTLTVCSTHKQAREAIRAIEDGDVKNYRERFDVKYMFRQDDYYHGF